MFLRFVLCHKLRLLNRAEATALVQAANTDGDGDISLQELSHMLLPPSQHDDPHHRKGKGEPERMAPVAQAALGKLKAGFVPRPEEFLSLSTLTNGVASICRPSELAKLDHLPAGRVSNVFSRAIKQQQQRENPEANERLVTLLQLKRVEGMPCPEHSVVGGPARAVRMCMFYAGGSLASKGVESIVGNAYKTAACVSEPKTTWVFPGTVIGAGKRIPEAAAATATATATAGQGAATDARAAGTEEASTFNDERIMLSCDPFQLQQDMDLSSLPDLKRYLFVLIEFTMQAMRPKKLPPKGRQKSAGRSPQRPGRRSGEGKRDDSSGSEDEGVRVKARASSPNRRAKLQESDSDTDSEDDDEDKEEGASEVVSETIEVSCGWVKVPLWELCQRERELLLEVRHGSPWGEEAGEPIPEDDLMQQNTFRHRIRHVPVVGQIAGLDRSCMLRVRVSPIKQSVNWRFSPLEDARSLGQEQLFDVLNHLPSHFALPVGGPGASSLAFFATFQFALRKTHALNTCALGVLPDMMNDPAMR